MSDFIIDVEVGEGVRRLPIYLLLDCSDSMAGTAIQAVHRGLELLGEETRADAFASQTVHLGVVLFGGTARLATSGLVAIEAFTPPELIAAGGTPLGAALRLLAESLDKDIRPCVPGQEKGDWKPVVYILTDGQPTDDWQRPRQAILDRLTVRVQNVITVGCGSEVNKVLLKQIAIGPTFMMDDSDASFKAFFQWVTQSIQRMSQKVSEPDGGQEAIDLPEAPAVMQYLP